MSKLFAMILEEQLNDARQEAIDRYSEYQSAIQDLYTFKGFSHERILRAGNRKAAWAEAESKFAELINQYSKQNNKPV